MANFLEGKQHHILYKTTNLITERYYIGMHSTNSLEDGYIGSGKRLWYEIRKYGRVNFKFEILEHCSTRAELVAREAIIVNEQEINREKCLNLKTGGSGGAHKAATKAFRDKLKNNPEFRRKFSETCSQRNKKQYEEGKRMRAYFYDWTGKTHSEETKQKISKANKGKGVGQLNSQYNTHWITNGLVNKKVKKDMPIPEGWHRGKK